MKTASIEELAYLMKQAKRDGSNKPIFFIGAGASKSGGIPLAREIVKNIVEKFDDNVRIKSLNGDAKTYSKLMGCLTPFERNNILRNYVENAKINVAHLYLAQLLTEGFIDYILTVNFDNLLLRALALFNNFPAVYDLTVLKDVTAPTLIEKSIVYLHGQHYDTWQLNLDKEIEKTKEVIPPILNSIKNNRPWVFVGYSGNDPVFDQIAKLGSFDRGLYWVTHFDNPPSPKVYTNLIEKNTENTYLIKGYDADAFMLKLNAELKLPQPYFIDKPFTSLKNTLDNLVDIDNNENFKGVKERLEIAKKYADMAQQQFEEEKFVMPEEVKNEIESDRVKKQIIDMIIKEEFNQDEIFSIEKSLPFLNNEEIKKLMAALFNHWGIVISKKAKQTNDEFLLMQGIEKFKKGTELNPENDSAFYNWGSSMFDLAKLRNDGDLFEQSVEKYKIATELNPSRRTRFL